MATLFRAVYLFSRCQNLSWRILFLIKIFHYLLGNLGNSPHFKSKRLRCTPKWCKGSPGLQWDGGSNPSSTAYHRVKGFYSKERQPPVSRLAYTLLSRQMLGAGKWVLSKFLCSSPLPKESLLTPQRPCHLHSRKRPQQCLFDIFLSDFNTKMNIKKHLISKFQLSPRQWSILKGEKEEKQEPHERRAQYLMQLYGGPGCNALTPRG